MPHRSWLERPWLVALATLALSLVPVWLAFASFRDAARQRDAELFDATTKLVQESVRLTTIRHLNLLNSLRNQMSVAADPLAPGVLLPLRQTEWTTRLPNWRALAYAAVTDGTLDVLWREGGEGAAELANGLSAVPGLADALATLRQRPGQLVTLPRPNHLLLVLGGVTNPQRTRVQGVIVGWLDLAGFCRGPQLPLVSEGVLALAPANENAPLTPGAQRLRIEEGSVVWLAEVSPGPRHASIFARPTQWFVLGGGAAFAGLLALLAGLAARSRSQDLRAAALHTALEAEREAGRLRSHFVNTVSHEFRTPLSVILSSADLLDGYGGQLAPERRSELLAQIQDSTRHLTQMVEEVLLLGRIESNRVQPRPAPLDVAAFCRDLAREVGTAQRDRNSIDVAAPPGLGTVALDAALLRSALVNLLTNAAKYSPPGRPVEFTLLRTGHELAFRVRDEGIGIPTADLPRVGEPFHRGANVGDAPGTGLGLAIVKRCATLLGGKFALESQEGRGTTVTLTLSLPVVA